MLCATMPAEAPQSPCQRLDNGQRKRQALLSNTAPGAQLPRIPDSSSRTGRHIHSTGAAPTLPPSPCSQEHVPCRAAGKVSFWGREERGESLKRRMQMGRAVQPPSRSQGDFFHKEISLILFPPYEIAEQSPLVSPGHLVIITECGAKTFHLLAGKGTPGTSRTPNKPISPSQNSHPESIQRHIFKPLLYFHM